MGCAMIIKNAASPAPGRPKAGETHSGGGPLYSAGRG